MNPPSMMTLTIRGVWLTVIMHQTNPTNHLFKIPMQTQICLWILERQSLQCICFWQVRYALTCLANKVFYGSFIFICHLIGDSEALSKWEYVGSPALVVLMVAFSFLVVVYLMNLFIGLLNIAIVKDNHRVSYLVHKAEVKKKNDLNWFYTHRNAKCEMIERFILY